MFIAIQKSIFFLILCLGWLLAGTQPPAPIVDTSPKVKRYVDRTTGKLKSNHFEKIRIKDLATFEGIRDNQLVGYGLVVGLNGSGDSLTSSPYTKESLTSMLERLGVNIRDGKLPAGKNVAAVMVTANLPPFARHGTKIDVSVSALGDAKDLRGGVLLVTPLHGADGEVYAVSQGTVSVSGIVAAGASASVTKGVPTAGMITNGGIVEKEINFDFESLQVLNMSLRNPDFTTADRMAFKINTFFNQTLAHAKDPSTIELKIPMHFKKNMVGFLTEIEQLRIRPDQTAKVVIDDTNGIIVAGNEVRISPIAINQGSITVTIAEEPIIQPASAVSSQTFINLVGGNNNSASQSNTNTSENNDVLKNSNVHGRVLKMQEVRRKTLDDTYKARRESIEKDAKIVSDAERKMQMEEVNKKYAEDLAKLEKEHLGQLINLQQSEYEKQSKRKDTSEGPEEETHDQLMTDANIKEEKGKFTIVNSGTTLEDLVNGLNALGVTTKEMGSILRAIKAAGALQADIKES